MHTGPPVVLLVIVLAVPLWSGCVAPTDVAPGPVPPASGPSPAGPTVPATPSDATDPRPPAFALRLTDARDEPLDAPRARAHIVLKDALNATQPLELIWSADGQTLAKDDHAIGPNETVWDLETPLDLPPGEHVVDLAAAWPGHAPVRASLTYRVDAPLRLLLNASEKYAADQNVFHFDHILPFLPGEDALVVLRRASDTYGFGLATPYRDDLESHFVDEINGTAFVWDADGAVSRNWMILVDDAPSPYAVDDIHPAPEQTVEFRYVRCYATGNCEDL